MLLRPVTDVTRAHLRSNAKVRHLHMTPPTRSHRQHGVCTSRVTTVMNRGPFRAAAGAEAEQSSCRAEQCAEALSLAALLTAVAGAARAAFMFSGETGAPVASGRGVAAKEGTKELVLWAIEAMRSLPVALFDRAAKHRPCSLLDRYGVIGMLILRRNAFGERWGTSPTAARVRQGGLLTPLSDDVRGWGGWRWVSGSKKKGVALIGS